MRCFCGLTTSALYDLLLYVLLRVQNTKNFFLKTEKVSCMTLSIGKTYISYYLALRGRYKRSKLFIEYL